MLQELRVADGPPVGSPELELELELDPAKPATVDAAMPQPASAASEADLDPPKTEWLQVGQALQLSGDVSQAA